MQRPRQEQRQWNGQVIGKVGIVVPLWKKRSKRTDKNTWRGITLLSVGTRVVASRLATWAETYLHEAQCGFRRGRGVDEVATLSRKITEEVQLLDGDAWIQ